MLQSSSESTSVTKDALPDVTGNTARKKTSRLKTSIDKTLKAKSQSSPLLQITLINSPTQSKYRSTASFFV